MKAIREDVLHRAFTDMWNKLYKMCIRDRMNDQFIQGVIFDWDRIDNDSYLKRIEAFGGVKKLDFNKPRCV